VCVLWHRVWVDCCQTYSEDPLPLPFFIHANDVLQRRRFASRENGSPSSCICVCSIVGYFVNFITSSQIPLLTLLMRVPKFTFVSSVGTLLQLRQVIVVVCQRYVDLGSCVFATRRLLCLLCFGGIYCNTGRVL